MAERVFTELEPDPALIAEAIKATIRERIPNAKIADDSMELALVEGASAEYATSIEVLSSVLDTVLAEWGRHAGLEQEQPRPATGTATITTDGREAYVLPAGSTMLATAADQSRIELATTLDTSIAAGPGAVTVTGVPVHATEDGTIGNQLSGDLEPDQAYVWLESATLESPTVGGFDGESEEEFLAKTAREIRLSARQVILPEDAAQRAMEHPAVGHATAIDLAHPDHPGVDTPNAFSLALRGPEGEPVSGPDKAEVLANLKSRREANAGIFLIDHTYTTVDVTMTVGAHPPMLAFAEDQVRAALQQWLHPANWPGSTQEEVPTEWWLPARKVRIGEALSIADACSTIAYVESSSVRLNGGTSDLTLPGLAPLTRPGTMAITVVERVL